MVIPFLMSDVSTATAKDVEEARDEACGRGATKAVVVMGAAKSRARVAREKRMVVVVVLVGLLYPENV